jgi:DUF1680 family protein
LYDNSSLDWRLQDGTPIRVQQKTNYPWEGTVKLTVSPAESKDFILYVRIPGWTAGASVAVNGRAQSAVKAGEYLAIKRAWNPGDVVTLDFPMHAEIIASNPRVAEDRGKVAVRRGPIIFCMEELDQPGGAALSDIAINVNQRMGKEFQSEYKADLLGGVEVLRHEGKVFESASAEQPLYMSTAAEAPKTRPGNLSFIPYYAWANRKPSTMQVWTPFVRS